MTSFIMHKFYQLSAVVVSLLLLAIGAHAQTGVQPCFRLPTAIVCAPATITPIDCSGVPPNLVVYDYGDGQLRLDKSFTFTRPGKYLIRQGLNTLGSGGNVSQPIELTVIEPRSPTFRIAACSNRAAIVEITDTTFPEYEIEWGDGTTTIAKSGDTKQHSYGAEGSFNVTVKGITGQNVACGSASQRINVVLQIPAPTLRSVSVRADGRAIISYMLPAGFNYRLQQVNIVDNTVKTFHLSAGSNSFTSPDITSAFDRYIYSIEAINPCNTGQPISYFNQVGVHTIRVTPLRELNRINWSAPLHLGFTSYTLFRNGTKIGEWTGQNMLQFEDRNITCGQQYCYRLETRYYNGAAVSISQEVCITTSRESDPQRFTEALATVTNEQVQITWRQPERTRVASVLLRKIAPRQPLQQITLTQTAPPYVDNNVFTAADAYCYQLSYIDNCGNQSPWTEPFCTAVINGKISGDSVLLNWQELRGYGAVNYLIEQLDENNRAVNIFRPTSRTSTFIPVGNFSNQLLRFRLVSLVNTQGGMVALYSNAIRLRINATLYYPTAFSPNNDGLNDTFGVTTRFIDKFNLQVFNRWGELIYYTDDPAARWDGTYKGVPVPTGTYALVIQAQDLSGRKIEEKAMLLITK